MTLLHSYFESWSIGSRFFEKLNAVAILSFLACSKVRILFVLMIESRMWHIVCLNLIFSEEYLNLSTIYCRQIIYFLSSVTPVIATAIAWTTLPITPSSKSTKLSCSKNPRKLSTTIAPVPLNHYYRITTMNRTLRARVRIFSKE